MAETCSFKFQDEISRDRRSLYHDHRQEELWPEGYTLTPESYWQEIEHDGWCCPHTAVEEGRCLFHLVPEKRDKYGYSEEDVTNSFLRAVASPDPELNRFIGATFQSLKLDHRELDGPHNFPIDLHYVTILDTLDLSNAVVSLPIRAPGIRINGGLNLDDTIFKRDVSFFCAELCGDVSAIDGQFKEARFRKADFRSEKERPSPVQFRWIQFEGYTDFREAKFDAVRFHDVDAGEIHFANAMFRSAYLDEILVTEELNLSGVHLSYLDVSNSSVERLNFTGATIQESGRCPGSIETLDSDGGAGDGLMIGVNFSESTIEYLEFTGITTPKPKTPVNFTDSVVSDGIISVGDTAFQYDFSNATIGNLQLREFGNSKFGEHVLFWETTFEGFDFSCYHNQLEKTNWDIHPHPESDVDNESFLEDNGLILTYLRAKNGANDVSDNISASKFFIKEMIYKRKRHRRKIVSTTGTDRVIHAVQYVKNCFLNGTSRYGERASFAVIAGIVVLLGWQYLASIVPWISGITNLLESFFVALVVFSLTRSIYR